MLFNSYEYLFLFLPVTLIGYFVLNRLRLTTAATAWLVLASLFFYSWWNVKYLALIISSILFNFGVGMSLRKTGGEGSSAVPKRLVLIIGITANLALLGYYKYTDFFITNRYRENKRIVVPEPFTWSAGMLHQVTDFLGRLLNTIR